MDAQQDAPNALDDMRRGRLAARKVADEARPVGLTGNQILAGIEKRIERATLDLEEGIYLSVVETAVTVLRDLEITDDLVDASQSHAERQKIIKTITDMGFRPIQLPDDEEEIKQDVVEIKQLLEKEDYLTADDWIDELDADSERALAHAQSWQERFEFNQTSLQLMQEHLQRAEAYLIEEAASAWQRLSVYPPGNWRDITADLQDQKHVFESLRENAFVEIASLNSMAQQAVPQAESLLAESGGQLVQAERQLRALPGRLAEVQTAEANLMAGLKLAQEEWETAVAFRDGDDPKIGAEVDDQLLESKQKLADARELNGKREFLAAMFASSTARQLATDAYAAAKVQVKYINSLQTSLEQMSQRATQQVKRVHAGSKSLIAQAQTVGTQSLLQEMN
ncbi:MAG: hypothetical protein KAG66_19365, partial [Methylococcales bacterium]|nr:hypothetical protein [Methylococcales bacterium]